MSNCRILFGFVAILGCLGCGGSQLTKVSGTITVAGAPVPAGTITFIPDTPGENASAQIGDGGQYELSTYGNTPGVAPGAYKVRIAAYTSQPDMSKKSDPAVARKYFDPHTSGLTATVVAGPPQTIDFQLEGP